MMTDREAIMHRHSVRAYEDRNQTEKEENK